MMQIGDGAHTAIRTLDLEWLGIITVPYYVDNMGGGVYKSGGSLEPFKIGKWVMEQCGNCERSRETDEVVFFFEKLMMGWLIATHSNKFLVKQ